MQISNVIALSMAALAIICFFRPFFIIFLLASVPVLAFLPTITKEEAQFSLFRIGSINIYLPDYLYMVLCILVFVLGLNNFLKNKSLLCNTFSSPLTKIIFIFLIWNLFIGLLSYLKGFQIQNILRLLSPDIASILVIFLPFMKDIENKKRHFLNYTLFLAVLLVLFGLIRYYVTKQIELTSSGTARSLLGFTTNIFIFPLCYLLFYDHRFRKYKFISFLVFCLLVIGIGLTGHRSGFVVLIFVMVVYFFSSSFNALKYMWVPLFTLSIIFLFILISPFFFLRPGFSFIYDTILRISDTFNLEVKTTKERIDKWSLSYQIMTKNPVIGLGRLPITTTTISKDTNLHLKYFNEFDRDAHNLFASKIAHEGILGLSVLILFFISIFYQIKSKKLLDEDYTHFYYVYFLSLLLLSMFNANFDEISCKLYFYSIIGFFNERIISHKIAMEQSEPSCIIEQFYEESRLQQ